MSASVIPPSLIPYLFGQKKDYSSLQDTVLRTNVIFIPLVVLTTSLRFWVRFRMLRSAGLDDIFMVVALILALFLSAACLVGEYFGLGKHIWNLNPNLLQLPHDVGRVTKTLFGAYLAYSGAITFTKLSIVATYSRILPPGGIRTIVHGSGVFVLIMWFISIFATIFTCIPVQAAWDYTIPNAKCYPVVKYFYVSVAFNIATDLLLCVLPMPTLWNLKMPKPQRVVLCLLFSMGTFACIASIIRVTQLHEIGGVDVSYQSVTSLNWSVIEVGTAIMCASLSALRPLATRYLPTFFSHFSHMDPTSFSGHKGTFSLSQSQTRSGLATSESMGQIYVQRSFDVSEMEEWPKSPETLRKPERAKRAGVVAFTGVSGSEEGRRERDRFERGSEEEFGVEAALSPTMSGGKPVAGSSCF